MITNVNKYVFSLDSKLSSGKVKILSELWKTGFRF